MPKKAVKKAKKQRPVKSEDLWAIWHDDHGFFALGLYTTRVLARKSNNGGQVRKVRIQTID